MFIIVSFMVMVPGNGGYDGVFMTVSMVMVPDDGDFDGECLRWYQW